MIGSEAISDASTEAETTIVDSRKATMFTQPKSNMSQVTGDRTTYRQPPEIIVTDASDDSAEQQYYSTLPDGVSTFEDSQDEKAISTKSNRISTRRVAASSSSTLDPKLSESDKDLDELVAKAKKVIPAQSEFISAQAYFKAASQRNKARQKLNKIAPDLVRKIVGEESSQAKRIGGDRPAAGIPISKPTSQKRTRVQPMIQPRREIIEDLPGQKQLTRLDWEESIFGRNQNISLSEADIRSHVEDLKDLMRKFCKKHFDYKMSSLELLNDFNLAAVADAHPELMNYVRFVADGTGVGDDQWNNFFLKGEYRWLLAWAVFSKALEIYIFGEPMFGATHEQRCLLRDFDTNLSERDGECSR